MNEVTHNCQQVVWRDVTQKNCNGRLYSNICFESAIEKIGNKLIPIYASAPYPTSPIATKLIGFATEPKFDIFSDSLSMTVKVFDQYSNLLKFGELCIAGHGEANWEETSERGYLQVDSNSYEFQSLYLASKSAFPVTLNEIKAED